MNDRPERKRSITQTVMAAIFQKKTPSPNKIRSPSSHQTSPSRFKFLISGKTKEKSQVIFFYILSNTEIRINLKCLVINKYY